MRELLEMFGYRTTADLIELIVTGIAILPGMLILGGHLVPGALVLWGLLCLLAIVGARSEAPGPRDKRHGPRNPRGH